MLKRRGQNGTKESKKGSRKTGILQLKSREGERERERERERDL